MYKHNEITHIHFEPTQKCQALCPMCDRTNNKHLKNADRSRLYAANLRYDDVKRSIDEQFKNAWNNYVLVEKNLATLKRTVEINDEMYKLTLADFQAGNTPIMAVFGMKTAHLMSEVAYKNAQVDLLIARYQLHKVLGLVNPLIK